MVFVNNVVASHRVGPSSLIAVVRYDVALVQDGGGLLPPMSRKDEMATREVV